MKVNNQIILGSDDVIKILATVLQVQECQVDISHGVDSWDPYFVIDIGEANYEDIFKDMDRFIAGPQEKSEKEKDINQMLDILIDFFKYQADTYTSYNYNGDGTEYIERSYLVSKLKEAKNGRI